MAFSTFEDGDLEEDWASAKTVGALDADGGIEDWSSASSRSLDEEEKRKIAESIVRSSQQTGMDGALTSQDADYRAATDKLGKKLKETSFLDEVSSFIPFESLQTQGGKELRQLQSAQEAAAKKAGSATPQISKNPLDWVTSLTSDPFAVSWGDIISSLERLDTIKKNDALKSIYNPEEFTNFTRDAAAENWDSNEKGWHVRSNGEFKFSPQLLTDRTKFADALKGANIPKDRADAALGMFDQKQAEDRSGLIALAKKTPTFQNFAAQPENQGKSDEEIYSRFEKSGNWVDWVKSNVVSMPGQTVQYVSSQLAGAAFAASVLSDSSGDETMAKVGRALNDFTKDFTPYDVRYSNVAGQTVSQFVPQIATKVGLGLALRRFGVKGQQAEVVSQAFTALSSGAQIGAENYRTVFEANQARYGTDEAHKMATEAFKKSVPLGVSELLSLDVLLSKAPKGKGWAVVKNLASSLAEVGTEKFQNAMSNTINKGASAAYVEPQTMGLGESLEMAAGTSLVELAVGGVQRRARNIAEQRVKEETEKVRQAAANANSSDSPQTAAALEAIAAKSESDAPGKIEGLANDLLNEMEDEDGVDGSTKSDNLAEIEKLASEAASKLEAQNQYDEKKSQNFTSIGGGVISQDTPSSQQATTPAPTEQPTQESQDGQTAKSSGSYPEVEGSTPSPATPAAEPVAPEGTPTQNINEPLSFTDIEFNDNPEYDPNTGKTTRSSGIAQIVSMADRQIALVNVNGVAVPFYLSTGKAGKKNVAAGKWYPILGLDVDGWINKGSQQEISSYYGSPVLRSIAEKLDNQLGTTTPARKVSSKAVVDSINKGIASIGIVPVSNGTSTTGQSISDNAKKLVNFVEGSNKQQATQVTPTNPAPVAETPAAEPVAPVAETTAPVAETATPPADQAPTQQTVPPTTIEGGESTNELRNQEEGQGRTEALVQETTEEAGTEAAAPTPPQAEAPAPSVAKIQAKRAENSEEFDNADPETQLSELPANDALDLLRKVGSTLDTPPIEGEETFGAYLERTGVSVYDFDTRPTVFNEDEKRYVPQGQDPFEGLKDLAAGRVQLQDVQLPPAANEVQQTTPEEQERNRKAKETEDFYRRNQQTGEQEAAGEPSKEYEAQQAKETARLTAEAEVSEAGDKGAVSGKRLPIREIPTGRSDESGRPITKVVPGFVNDSNTMAEVLHQNRGVERVYVPASEIENLDPEDIFVQYDETGQAYVVAARHKKYGVIYADTGLTQDGASLAQLHEPTRLKNSQAQTEGKASKLKAKKAGVSEGEITIPEMTEAFEQRIARAGISKEEKEKPESVAKTLQQIYKKAQALASETVKTVTGETVSIGAELADRIGTAAVNLYLARLRGVDRKGKFKDASGVVADIKKKVIAKLQKRPGTRAGVSLDQQVGEDGATVGDFIGRKDQPLDSMGYPDVPLDADTESQGERGLEDLAGAAPEMRQDSNVQAAQPERSGTPTEVAQRLGGLNYEEIAKNALAAAEAELTPAELKIWRETLPLISGGKKRKDLTDTRKQVVKKVQNSAKEKMQAMISEANYEVDTDAADSMLSAAESSTQSLNERQSRQERTTRAKYHSGQIIDWNGGPTSKGFDTKRVLSSIAEDAKLPQMVRIVARFLANSNVDFSNVKFELIANYQKDLNWAGLYTAGDKASSGRIQINISSLHRGGNIAQTIVHEALHHVAFHKLRPSYDRTGVEREAYRDLVRILTHVRKQRLVPEPGKSLSRTARESFSKDDDFYGASNLDELFTETLTNERFAAWLSSQAPIPGMQPKNSGVFRNLYDQIKQFLKNLIGGQNVRPDSLLSQAMDNILALAKDPQNDAKIKSYQQGLKTSARNRIAASFGASDFEDLDIPEGPGWLSSSNTFIPADEDSSVRVVGMRIGGHERAALNWLEKNRPNIYEKLYKKSKGEVASLNYGVISDEMEKLGFLRVTGDSSALYFTGKPTTKQISYLKDIGMILEAQIIHDLGSRSRTIYDPKQFSTAASKAAKDSVNAAAIENPLGFEFKTQQAIRGMLDPNKRGVLKGLTASPDGTVPLQNLRAKIAKAFSSEEAGVIFPVLESMAKNGRVDVSAAAQALQTMSEAKARVTVLSAVDAETDQTRSGLIHQLDTSYPGWEQDDSDYSDDPVFMGLRDELDSIDRSKIREAESATARFKMVNPKPLDEMEDAGDIVVEEPVRRGNPVKHSENLHFPTRKNVIGFGRKYTETLPNGEKATFVFEVQSDWAGKARKAQEVVDAANNRRWGVDDLSDDAFLDTIVDEDGSPSSLSDTTKAVESASPLLSVYENLVLKAAIQDALAKGQTKLIITDAETAMMTEQHDRYPEFSLINITSDQIRKNIQERGLPFSIEEKSDVDGEGVPYDQLDITLLEGSKGTFTMLSGDGLDWDFIPSRSALNRVAEDLFVSWTKLPVKKTITQEPGMRAAYDPQNGRLHNIMRKLTGDKGRIVDLGRHQNADRPPSSIASEEVNRLRSEGFTDQEIQDRFTEKNVGSRVFRNPDGTPKKNITGIVYDLTPILENQEKVRALFAAPVNPSVTPNPRAARVDMMVQEEIPSLGKTAVRSANLSGHPAQASFNDNGEPEISYDPVAIATEVEGLDDDEARLVIRKLLGHEQAHVAGLLNDYDVPDAQGRRGREKIEAFHDEVMTEEMRQQTADAYVRRLDGMTDEDYAEAKANFLADKVAVAGEFKRMFLERHLTGESYEDSLATLARKTGNKFTDLVRAIADYIKGRIRMMQTRFEMTKDPRLAVEIMADRRMLENLNNGTNGMLGDSVAGVGSADTRFASRAQRTRMMNTSGGWKAGGGLTQNLMDAGVGELVDQKDAAIRAANFKVSETARKFDRLVKKYKPDAQILNTALGSTENTLTDAQYDQWQKLQRAAKRETDPVKRQAAMAASDSYRLTQVQANNKQIRADRQAALNKLPKELAATVDVMRGHIDGLSTVLKNKGLVGNNLQITLGANLEVYLNRSYEVFDNPEWTDFILTDQSPESQQIRTNAARVLRAQLVAEEARRIRRDARMNNAPVPTRAQAIAAAQATVTNNDVGILMQDYLRVADNNGLTISGGNNPAKKNTSILKLRGQIPKEIRELWGEYKDPQVNYAKTYMKMASFVATHNFQQDLLNMGLSRATPFLWKEGSSQGVRPTHWVEVVPGLKDTPNPNPLAGVYGPPIIAEAFEDIRKTYKHSLVNDWMTGLTGLAMASKTIYNPPQTYIRNILGNGLIMVSQGYAVTDIGKLGFLTRLAKSANVTGPSLVGARPERSTAVTDYIERMIKLGVMGDNVKANVIKNLTSVVFDRDPGKAFNGALSKALTTAKGVNDRLTDAYQAGDDLWKIVAFESERSVFARAFPNATPESLDRMAADRVRDVVPTYSKIPKVVQEVVKRQPYLAPYISWTSEIIRTFANTYKHGWNDATSNNPVLRASGLKRLASITVAQGLLVAIAYGVRELSGMDDEDEERLKRFLPDWQVNALLMLTGKKENGKFSFWDLSYLNPYDVLHEPFFAMGREIKAGGDFLGVASTGFSKFMDPWTSEQIFFGALMDAARGVTAEGRPLFELADSKFNKNRARIGRIVESITPGAYNFGKRMYMAATGQMTSSGRAYNLNDEFLGAISGQRPSEVDPLQNFKQRNVPALNRMLQSADSLATKEYRKGGTPDLSKIKENYVQANNARLSALREIRRDVDALVGLGVPNEKVMQTLAASGVSKQDMEQIAAGKYVRRDPSNDALLNAVGLPEYKSRIEAMRGAVESYPEVQTLYPSDQP